MTVAELIAALQKENPEEEIFKYDIVYGYQEIDGPYRATNGKLLVD